MAFNGAGVFNRVYNWTTDKNLGVKIQASKLDTEMDGFATGLTNTITRDGQSTITAAIPFNSQKITGLGNATLDADGLNRITADGRFVQKTAASMTLIQTQTVVGVGAVDFINLPSGNAHYFLTGSGFGNQAAGATFGLQTSADNGASFYASSGHYYWAIVQHAHDGTETLSGSSTTGTYMLIGAYGQSNWLYAGVMRIWIQPGDIANANAYTTAIGDCEWTESGGLRKALRMGARANTPIGGFNALRIGVTAGTITGKFSLYGMKE